MASLTGLSKAIIGLVVVGAVAATVWQLGFRGRAEGIAAAKSGNATPKPSSTTPPGGAVAALPVAPAAPATPTVAAAPATVPVAPSNPVPERPVKAVAPAADAAKAPLASLDPSSRAAAAQESESGRKALHNGDFALARVHLERAVKGGDAAAACYLGEMTIKGQGGIPANQDKAAELFRAAQAGGVMCFTLAK